MGKDFWKTIRVGILIFLFGGLFAAGMEAVNMIFKTTDEMIQEMDHGS